MSYKTIRYHRPSKVYGRSTMIVNTQKYKDADLIITFTKLIESLPQSREGEYLEPLIMAKFTNDIGDTFYQFEPILADNIKNLVHQIKETLQAAYDKGKNDGKNILIQLNNGEMTLDDFDKK